MKRIFDEGQGLGAAISRARIRRESVFEMNYFSAMLKTRNRWLQAQRPDSFAEEKKESTHALKWANATDTAAIKPGAPKWDPLSRPAPYQAPFEEVFVGEAARLETGDLTKFHAKLRLQVEALREERRRLARNIHDGILQALTGAAMQLEAASQLIESDPGSARACVQVVCELIAAEQRELRLLIRNHTEPATPNASVSISEIASVLERIRDRIGRQWALAIELTIGGHGHVSRALSEEVYNVVQEALANVARHARANVARVSLVLQHDKVSITVADDGCGFPFRGRFDLPALIARDIGPRSLRERITARRGSMVLTSSLSGTDLAISLPLSQDPCLMQHQR